MMQLSIISFFINYIFIVYIFEIINLSNCSYNFGQI